MARKFPKARTVFSESLSLLLTSNVLLTKNLAKNGVISANYLEHKKSHYMIIKYPQNVISFERRSYGNYQSPQ